MSRVKATAGKNEGKKDSEEVAFFCWKPQFKKLTFYHKQLKTQQEAHQKEIKNKNQNLTESKTLPFTGKPKTG